MTAPPDTPAARAAVCNGKVSYPNGAIAHRVFRRTRVRKFLSLIHI